MLQAPLLLRLALLVSLLAMLAVLAAAWTSGDSRHLYKLAAPGIIVILVLTLRKKQKTQQ